MSMNTNEMWSIYDYYDLERAAKGKLRWERVEPICYATSKDQISNVAEDLEARRPDIIIGNPGETPQDIAKRM